MADNTTLPGTGEIYAAQDRGGIKFQKVLVEGNTETGATDAFGRLRVSEPVTIFDSKLLGSDDAPLIWDEALESGSGITASTPTEAKPYIDFTSTNVTAGLFTRQTFRRFNYQPGKSQLILMTGVLELASGTKTGCERRIGYFDDNNGAFFESDAGTIGVTVRTNDSGSPADTTVTQANWNLDNLDGDADAANPSGDTLDITKAQIFVIDFQWLSVGRIRFGFELEGRIHYIHQINQTNTLAIPWCSTPNLPLRYQIITTTDSGVNSMRVICSAVISEGGQEGTGLTHSHATTDHVNANTQDTIYALLGIRLKTTALSCTLQFLSTSILSETNDEFEWQLIINPTVAGTFNYSNKTNSCVQTATGNTSSPSTNTITGGTIVARGFGARAASETIKVDSSQTLGVAIDGTTLDTAVLTIRPLGSNADIQGALNWRELL
jgi:hypothetical protein